MTPKESLELLEKLHDKLGLWEGISLFILLLILGLLTLYIKSLIKGSAEAFYKKTIEEFKSQLNKNLQTQVGLFFRDENVRNSLLASIGQKSFEKKIECWQLTQAMYFQYQKIWNFSEQTNSTEYSELDSKLNDLRIKLFNETIYIGYELSSKLIRQNSLMRENLRNRRMEINYSGSRYQQYNETPLQNTLSRIGEVESKISDLLYETEKWIITKLHSDQTLEKFEFTQDQLDKIKEERNKQFDNITE